MVFLDLHSYNIGRLSCLPLLHLWLQVLGSPWTVCTIPTTVLWPSRILELVVLLCSVQLPTDPAVFLYHHQELIGTFLMEVVSQILTLYHTTEPGLILRFLLLEQYFSTVTLELPQQESSAVTYLMPLELFRASMWGYILPPQVSPVHWKVTSLYNRSISKIVQFGLRIFYIYTN